MPNRENIKKLIDQAYEARRIGDIEPLIALFHPDARFVIAGSATVAEGHEELRTVLLSLISAFDFVERYVLSVLIEDERAAVHSRVKLRFIPKGKMVTTELLDLLKFENGKIVELVEFVDTALVNDLMR